MSKIKFDPEKEMQVRGIYPQTGTWYGNPYMPVEMLTQPITPAENLLRYYRGEDYEWIPDLSSDSLDLTPDCNPDASASDYTGGLDAFGVKWIPVGDGSMLPAFVEPGFFLIDDIADWRTMKWPDVDSWGWEEYGKMFRERHKDDDRLRRGTLLSGYFERLISIMTFEGAAMALITDPDSVKEFFDKLTDLNMQIMDHYIKDFGCKAFLMHDDWAAQRSPFFSLNTVMELIVPYVKRLVDYAHSKGMIFTLHSCGNGVDLIPAYKATGIDAWQVQDTAVDMEKARELCGDDLMLEMYPVIPDELEGEALEKYLEETMRAHCTDHRGMLLLMDYNIERVATTRKILYRLGREIAWELTGGSCCK